MSTNPTNGPQSQYKTLGKIRNGVKIWKFQNNMSAIDVTHILNSYREKIKGDSKELVYAGRLCFAVTSGGNHGKAYLDKKEAKLLFTMIQNGSFTKNYPAPEGYKNFGGSVKEGKTLANILKINVFTKEVEDYKTKVKKNVHKVEVSIQELPGEKTKTGGYKAVGRPIKEVKTIFDAKDLLSMAVECMDFIRAAEASSMAEGLPLNTITNYDYEPIPNQTGKAPVKNNAPVNAPKTTYTKEELETLEPREFHNLYLKKEAEMKTYQEEFNRRVELKKKREQAETPASTT